MIQINSRRFLSLMEEQAQIGKTPEGGVSRPALSENDILVRNWFRQLIEENGFEYRMDGAGNQSAILRTEDASAQTLLIGSHLDSVPNGGRYDGALGVLAAFEAMATIRDHQVALPFHLEVINFTDEEGSLCGLFGSRAAIGKLTKEELNQSRGGLEQLRAGMARIGIDEDSTLNAVRDPSSLAGYIEVHIEQGTRLEENNLNIGVVTSIVGIRPYWLTFIGEAAHAGAKPMDKRKDAFWGASAFAQRAREIIMSQYHPGVVNIGAIELKPGAFNIVPGIARLALEFRHGDPQQLDAMETTLLELAESIAAEQGLGLEKEELGAVIPAPMSDDMINAIEEASQNLSLSSTRLMSFAGHDAQSLANITSSGMFFVPSVDGVSHNPAEYTSPEDCVNAANIMTHAVLAFAKKYGG